MTLKKTVGNLGEILAANFLVKNGYNILARKYYSLYGEADLVAEKDGQLVFVEVKTRTTKDFGLPEEAINRSKLKKLYQTAISYLEDKKVEHDNFRLDLVAVELDGYRQVQALRHYENIYKFVPSNFE